MNEFAITRRASYIWTKTKNKNRKSSKMIWKIVDKAAKLIYELLNILLMHKPDIHSKYMITYYFARVQIITHLFFFDSFHHYMTWNCGRVCHFSDNFLDRYCGVVMLSNSPILAGTIRNWGQCPLIWRVRLLKNFYKTLIRLGNVDLSANQRCPPFRVFCIDCLLCNR